MEDQLRPQYKSIHIFVPSEKTLDVLRGIEGSLVFQKQWNVDLNGTRGMLISLIEPSGHPILASLTATDDFQNATDHSLAEMVPDSKAALRNTGNVRLDTNEKFYVLSAKFV